MSKDRTVIRETEHYSLEVGTVENELGELVNSYVIRNKEHGVDEVVMNLLHIIEPGLEKLEELTYPKDPSVIAVQDNLIESAILGTRKPH